LWDSGRPRILQSSASGTATITSLLQLRLTHLARTDLSRLKLEFDIEYSQALDGAMRLDAAKFPSVSWTSPSEVRARQLDGKRPSVEIWPRTELPSLLDVSMTHRFRRGTFDATTTFWATVVRPLQRGSTVCTELGSKRAVYWAGGRGHG